MVIKSERKKQIKEDDLFNALKLVLKSLKEKHDLKPQELIELLTPSDDGEVLLPISVLKNRTLGVLESTVLYLKDEHNMRYSEIARKLNRDDRTIWTAYQKAKKKMKDGK